MNKTSFVALFIGVIGVAGCADPYPPTLRPDYTIHVVSTPKGDVAIPPACPSWTVSQPDPFDNQLFPQYGCATARNLALEVERPDDLVQGRQLGPERGVNAVGSIRRYDNNQTRGLIDPDTNPDSSASITTSSTAASALSGDVTGSASSSAAAASTASGP